MNTARSAKLVIFLKAPRLGTVKTRLAASLGHAAALSAYKKITERLFKNLRRLPGVQIRFSPDDAEPEVREWLGNGFDFQPQGSGDLGERLYRAFEETFSAGNERVVVIGSDCPYVTKNDVRAAFDCLETHDAVLGPANDGGYWLIGLRARQPALFKNIKWSTESVLKETLSRAGKTKLNVHLLRTLDDIDTAEDWERFLAFERENGTSNSSTFF